MQKPWRDVHYWLASPSLLSLLSYRTKTTSPELITPTRGYSPLISNWENALQLDFVSHGCISSTKVPFSVIAPAVSIWHKTSQYKSHLWQWAIGPVTERTVPHDSGDALQIYCTCQPTIRYLAYCDACQLQRLKCWIHIWSKSSVRMFSKWNVSVEQKNLILYQRFHFK